jgi:hypothetical protein
MMHGRPVAAAAAAAAERFSLRTCAWCYRSRSTDNAGGEQTIVRFFIPFIIGGKAVGRLEHTKCS